jgi:uncharacterized protein (DUF2147 family)
VCATGFLPGRGAFLTKWTGPSRALYLVERARSQLFSRGIGEPEAGNPVSGSPRMWKRIRSKAVIGAALVLMADARPEPVEGRWLTEPKTAVVEILRCGGGSLCGRLLWFRMKPSDHNPQALDIRNPDPGLRNRPLCGLMVMWGFQPDGQNQWSDGSLYDPESGGSYHGTMRLQSDGTLNLRGYIGISLFGRSQDWTRFTQTISGCPAE